MSVLKSPLDVCRFAEGSNKPNYLEVYTRTCYGAKRQEILETLHEHLSTLKLRLAANGNSGADTVWLKAVEKTPRLTALARLLLTKESILSSRKFVPKALSRTILSAHLGSSLTYIVFERLTFHAQMGRWLGRVLIILESLCKIELTLCTLFGTCEEVIANSLNIACFSVNIWTKAVPVEFTRIPHPQESPSNRRGYIWLTGSFHKFGPNVSRYMLSKIEKLSGVRTAQQFLAEAEIPTAYIDSIKYLI